jgi:hypothetical protein
LPAMAKLSIILGQNHFSEPNQHIFTFLHLILLCRITYWAPLEMLLVPWWFWHKLYIYIYIYLFIYLNVENLPLKISSQRTLLWNTKCSLVLTSSLFQVYYFLKLPFPICQIHFAKILDSQLSNCQLHIVKLLSPHCKCYIANFPNWLHFLGSPFF